MAFDFNALGKNDKIALVAGGVASLLTFFPWYYTISLDGEAAGAASFSQSDGFNAWHEIGVLGSLLIIAATVILVLRLLGDVLPAGIPWNLITAAAAGLGAIIVILYGLLGAGSGVDFPGLEEGIGWSGWLLFVAAIVFTVFAFFGFQSSGEKIPEFNKGNDGTPPPPAPPAPPSA